MSDACADNAGDVGSFVEVGERVAILFQSPGKKSLIRLADRGKENPRMECLRPGTVLVVQYMPGMFRMSQKLPKAVHAMFSIRTSKDVEYCERQQITFLQRRDPNLGPLTLPVRMLDTEMVFDVVYVPGEPMGGARDLIAQINEIKK